MSDVATKDISKAVAETPKKLTLRERIQTPAVMEEFKRALPKHLTADRMVRVALTAMTRTPGLNDCDPQSFLLAMMNLSQWGLEPDGRRAHLIPFKNNAKQITECQVIVDYKGLAELAFRSGFVKSIDAMIVHEGDVFEFDRGRVTKHVPWYFRRDARPEEKGPIIAAYCIVVLLDGAEKCEVMTYDELMEIRGRSSGYNSAIKYKKTHPWITDEAEMMKKTVFRRASKWIPLSPEIRDAAEAGDEIEYVQTATATAVDEVRALLTGTVDGTVEPEA